MINVALIGFGTVGTSFARVLQNKRKMLRDQFGFECSIVAVSDINRGSVMDSNGLDLGTLLKLVDSTGKIGGYRGGTKGLDSLRTIKESGADVVVEVAWTNLQTGEPGLTHIREALKSGKHVATSNKGPIALAFPELKKLADDKGVQLRFECTVMSGTPAIMVGVDGLAGHVVSGFRGILNGTTNYILTKMEEGGSYADILKEAQRLGYAEAEPSADVEGWDAVGKTVIVANSVMGAGLKVADVEREGITKITSSDIESARRQGKRIKLIARAWREGAMVKGKVSPELVELTDPLASVSGTTNALTYVTDGLGPVTIIGKGAGGIETGHGILGDLLAIDRFTKRAKL
jgi:homoserine dehydrogenase